jgi:DNA-binding beta-propeller fold protein YncE
MKTPLVAILTALSISASADTIYVSSIVNNVILKFGPAGGNGTYFGATGNGLSYGLAVDRSGVLFGADFSGGNIDKFDSTGQGSIFASGLGQPVGLAFDNVGNLYADTTDGTLWKFNREGQGSILASGLNAPMGIAFDGVNLYVAEFGSSTIAKFDSHGQESVFASGVQAIGLTCDRHGNLYASAVLTGSSIGEVLKFDSSGQSSIFCGPYLTPNFGIAFDSLGNFYVADLIHGAIDKFDPYGNTSIFAYGLNVAGFIAIVPEPSALALSGLGGITIWFARRRSE